MLKSKKIQSNSNTLRICFGNRTNSGLSVLNFSVLNLISILENLIGLPKRVRSLKKLKNLS